MGPSDFLGRVGSGLPYSTHSNCTAAQSIVCSSRAVLLASLQCMLCGDGGRHACPACWSWRALRLAAGKSTCGSAQEAAQRGFRESVAKERSFSLAMQLRSAGPRAPVLQMVFRCAARFLQEASLPSDVLCAVETLAVFLQVSAQLS